MQTIDTIDAVRTCLRETRQKGLTIGFVPTMGYLHEGHARLIAQAKAECHVVVVSIFVNPLQFGPTEDLSRYPRDIERDSQLCADVGVDFLFYPDVAEMYPTGYDAAIHIGGVSQRLEGESRPGHFDGVATVVAKLFNIVAPTIAFFGAKDFQQCLVVKKLVRDLNFDVQIRVCPTVRDNDGLAKSSRNVYLSADDRSKALGIQRSLQAGMQARSRGIVQRDKLQEIVAQALRTSGIEPIYAEVVDAHTMESPDAFEEKTPLAFLVAAKVGSTRLIDNMVWSPEL